MIKLPDFDDQKYSDIVDAAKRRIPVIFSEWTDYNEHDPGITILELFAWLKEMQQYYLNRISDKSRINMLRLLGMEMLSAAPSEVTASFSDTAPERLSQGATVRTQDGIEFVSAEEYLAAPFKIGSVSMENEGEYIDVTSLAGESGTVFYPFGGKLFSGERSLYIEISEITNERFFDSAELLFDIYDRLPVKRNSPAENTPPPRGIVWEYSTAHGFSPCKVLKDETFGLSFSGAVTLKTGRDIAPLTVAGLGEHKWIRARLIYCGCEDMPQLRRVYNGAIKLTQKSRLSSCCDYILGGRSIVNVSDMLAAEGICFAFVRDSGGWLYAQNAKIAKSTLGAVAYMQDYAPLCADDGAPDLRVVCCNESFGRNKMFLSSDGLPCQRYEFDPDGEVLCEELRVMVKDRENAEVSRWHEYRYVSSLSLAGPYDRCFTYDHEKRMIVFGDNEHGEVPPPGNENIIVMSCSVTRGAAGNVKAGNIKELNVADKVYPLTQSFDSAGGRSRESIQHALGRLKTLMSECTRAVTEEDYRTAALKTPGLRIADAKAIPFFDAASSQISEDKAPASVAVVVLPYSAESFPMPDERFLSVVREHLEDYRLITTKITVIPPIYVRVDISAEVICTTSEEEQARKCVSAALKELFSVYGADGRTRFGEPISENSITACICSVDGILSVKQLRIAVNDARCGRDNYGRIIIPPHAVAFCGNVQLDMAES